MTRERRPSGGYALALILTTGVGALLIGALLYATPADFVGTWGMAPENARRFRGVFRGAALLPTFPKPIFTWLLRGLWLVTWAGWIGSIVIMFRGAVLAWRVVLPVVATVAVLLALFSPPVLSRDVYGYVAYGRVVTLGFNPYLTDRPALEAAGDPSAAFLVWRVPLGYGPLWTLAAGAVASVGTPAGVHGEVIAHKLLAALALIAAALGAARLVGHREPGREMLTFIAVGLNPLCLLEGPGSGHNDFMMMALLLWGAVLAAERKWRAGALAVGLAIAIKPVAVVAAPLLAVERWAGGAAFQRGRDVAWVFALTALPVIALSLLFGGPFLLARSLGPQSSAGIRAGAAHSSLVFLTLGGVLLASALWTQRLARQQYPAAWLTAWIPASMGVILLTAWAWLPWYFVWPLMAALCGWDERHRIMTIIAGTLAMLAMWGYTLFG